MKFSVIFFSSVATERLTQPYDLLMRVSRIADEGDFAGIWTPERHFHAFGGLFPNPAITSAAIAAITRRLQIRAGSLISPLHQTIRIAEDWSMIDNLSGGRAAISFGTGWNVNDFIFFPERYSPRKQIMQDQIELVQRLWSGQTVIVQNSFGKNVELTIYPRPIQERLPIWITSSGSESTFIEAGRRRLNVLTHFAGQTTAQLKRKISLYRDSFPGATSTQEPGTVSVMVHTFLGESKKGAVDKSRDPLKSYLKSALELEYLAAQGGGTVSGGRRAPSEPVESDMEDELLELTVDRYLDHQSLIGSIDSAGDIVAEFENAGIDELACLIDFGLADEDVLASMKKLAILAGKTASQ